MKVLRWVDEKHENYLKEAIFGELQTGAQREAGPELQAIIESGDVEALQFLEGRATALFGKRLPDSFAHCFKSHRFCSSAFEHNQWDMIRYLRVRPDPCPWSAFPYFHAGYGTEIGVRLRAYEVDLVKSITENSLAQPPPVPSDLRSHFRSAILEALETHEDYVGGNSDWDLTHMWPFLSPHRWLYVLNLPMVEWLVAIAKEEREGITVESVCRVFQEASPTLQFRLTIMLSSLFSRSNDLRLLSRLRKYGAAVELRRGEVERESFAAFCSVIESQGVDVVTSLQRTVRVGGRARDEQGERVSSENGEGREEGQEGDERGRGNDREVPNRELSRETDL
uniref:Uncharacterized protein n=1 Tax=Chromera velia CCMP2878 TaxID=1169474 RepID=A0A0G4FWQ4_9ALVE|eukprot:Cvel_3843.t1-p1 / transcript=Cvel_3843.t1 / gene=Cvel_3843 / organism=Chromera_velia_CCMP2878 / gene_product=hypothetical protein / transcript_product=hypothetical protein / location=Cvel_scaffold162:92991-94617(-) / protein_length=337 / sequence_SO=supercontig / SO=protein_coding / is_pseudo=false